MIERYTNKKIHRPCPPLTTFVPRHYRSLALATLALRSPTAPCASATPPCPPFGYASLRVAFGSLAWPSAKSVGANAPTPRLRRCQPSAPASLRSPGDCLHVTVSLQFGMNSPNPFSGIWIPAFGQPHFNYRQGATESKIRRPIGEVRPFSH